MAKIFPYTRVSTFDQIEALDQQDRIVLAYSEFLKIKLQDQSIEVLHIFRDTESAFKVPFSARPMGSVICRFAQRGDHIVIARVNRIFRNQLDMCNQVKSWLERGINVHFATEQLDCSTSSGKMLLGILTSIAEGESASLSERQKLSCRERYEIKGYGTKLMNVLLVKPPNCRYATLARKNIAVLRLAAFLRRMTCILNGKAMSWEKVSDAIEEVLARRENRRVKLRSCRYWCPSQLYKSMRKMLLSKHQAITTAWCCVSFRNGAEIMKLTPTGANQYVNARRLIGCVEK